MTLPYTESADLMTDLAFRGRIKVACLKFANYIWEEDFSTPAHNTRMRWAQSTFSNAEASASAIQPAVVMDTQVQDAGATIADDALQTVTETCINKTF